MTASGRPRCPRGLGGRRHGAVPGGDSQDDPQGYDFPGTRRPLPAPRVPAARAPAGVGLVLRRAVVPAGWTSSFHPAYSFTHALARPRLGEKTGPSLSSEHEVSAPAASELVPATSLM